MQQEAPHNLYDTAIFGYLGSQRFKFITIVMSAIAILTMLQLNINNYIVGTKLKVISAIVTCNIK